MRTITYRGILVTEAFIAQRYRELRLRIQHESSLYACKELKQLRQILEMWRYPKGFYDAK